ncbi:MAG: hypothetical protein PHR15_03835 [Atopobiaceae bacterium]|jgi:hypothetical protein|nr:hypothetical protein [Atopobiaceae bacterium]MCH4180162.1 hypothetical protein [Atopobiaceae bacterium]MCH4214332.1 hypothetical protein [Atopobiaceae bacterium]MCH4276608.1 hypothetical protein [Atopobiaceae bacterium]MCI1227020.1 hypothetical protein [Atopobiaceae bacterium]
MSERSAIGTGMRGEDGQMTVELAALVPVVIVVAVIVLNLARFTELCARFDRVSLDVVVSQGTAPAGGQDALSGVDAVRSALEGAVVRGDLPLGGSCEVEVSSTEASAGAGGAVFSLAPRLERYTCTLVYHPWPSAFAVAGVSAGVPISLTHERTFVIDRYRTGVVG